MDSWTINEYEIIEAFNRSELVEKVRNKIKEGWEPFERIIPVIPVTPRDKIFYLQAMVKGYGPYDG